MKKTIQDIIEMEILLSKSKYFSKNHNLEDYCLPQDLKIENIINLTDEQLLNFSLTLLSSDIINDRWTDTSLPYSCGIEPRSKDLLEQCELYGDYVKLMKSKKLKKQYEEISDLFYKFKLGIKNGINPSQGTWEEQIQRGSESYNEMGIK